MRSDSTKVPLGQLYFENILLLPEFDFYINKPEDENTNSYLLRNRILINDRKHKPIIWEIQRQFAELINKAQQLYNAGEVGDAIKVYEEIISEEYYMPSPYDKLIKIYSKAKLKDEEIRILNLSISFFSRLKERQKEYVLHLAEKHNRLDYAVNRINNGQKIFYYGGAFELYNPFPIIDKWQSRLAKIQMI